VKDDEEGKSWDCSRSASDHGPDGSVEAGEHAVVGKDERAPSGVPSERLVSRSDGGTGFVGKADGCRQGREMGGALHAADLVAEFADDAGSGSDETGDAAGGVCGGCESVRTVGDAIFGGAARFCVSGASVFRSDERRGLDEVGMAAYGSSFSAVRDLGKTK
jgi:hypothetical protein